MRKITVAQLLLETQPDSFTDEEKAMLRKIKPNPGCISVRFPMDVHHEENRQEHLRADREYYYTTGWMPPKGRAGWWRFRRLNDIRKD